MNNSLAKTYTLPSLFLFALPNMLMMLIFSLYTIVDGTFVAKFVGTTALSALNMVYPVICIEMAAAIMLATGGNAVIARWMGEGRYEQARRVFTFLILTELAAGVLIAVCGNLFADQIVLALGATPRQFALSREYIRVFFAFAPCLFLQCAFQIFFVTAGKPAVGLAVTILSGITNIVLDYVFLVPLNTGIGGAALATGIGYSLTSAVGVVYFTCFRKKHLYFEKPKADRHFLLHTCANGSSEMVTNLSNAVTTYLFNAAFLRFYGEDGVAAITIILYFQYVFTSLFFGYSNGIAPIVSFKFGEKNHTQLRRLFRSSLVIVTVCSAAAVILSQPVLRRIVTIFAPEGSSVYNLTTEGFRIYVIAFLFMGFSIFASAWFTALSNGRVSATISFARTFLFLAGALVFLPFAIGSAGAWIAVPAAETAGILLAAACLKKYRKIYRY